MAKLFLLVILIGYTADACTFCRSAVPATTPQKSAETITPTRTPSKQANNLSNDFFNSKSTAKPPKQRSFRIINSGIYE